MEGLNTRFSQSVRNVVCLVTLVALAACQSQQSQSQSSSQSASSSSSTTSSSSTVSPNNSSVAEPASQSGQSQGYVVNGEVLTEEEYVRVLEGEMDTSVAVFDGMILDERETVQGIEDANSDEGFPDGTEDQPLFEEGDLAGGGEGDQTDGLGIPEMPSSSGTDSAIETSPSSDSDGRTSSDTVRSDGGVPADIKDGSDDDIVARQIREAAMNEKDPVLKEKLWNEYRKYKNQSVK